ncbi:hypothetical protein AMECASPLE_015735 [Ameca splendens]|uniref:Uncharacterized protein n=1 Tax=Ameca splendens TaxID=208324 RepID=A0ABV0XF31_9TELE
MTSRVCRQTDFSPGCFFFLGLSLFQTFISCSDMLFMDLRPDISCPQGIHRSIWSLILSLWLFCFCFFNSECFGLPSPVSQVVIRGQRRLSCRFQCIFHHGRNLKSHEGLKDTSTRRGEGGGDLDMVRENARRSKGDHLSFGLVEILF